MSEASQIERGARTGVQLASGHRLVGRAGSLLFGALSSMMMCNADAREPALFFVPAPNPKRRRPAMTDRWPRARTKGQMAQTRNKHHNLQQAIYLKARTFHTSMRDRCALFRGPPPYPVRFVDHHEAKTFSLSVSFGLDIWAGGFVPSAFHYRDHEELRRAATFTIGLPANELNNV